MFHYADMLHARLALTYPHTLSAPVASSASNVAYLTYDARLNSDRSTEAIMSRRIGVLNILHVQSFPFAYGDSFEKKACVAFFHNLFYK